MLKQMSVAGAPLEVTEDLLTTFNISLVARGTVSETGGGDGAEHARYMVPKQRGIMRCGAHPCSALPIALCAPLQDIS